MLEEDDLREIGNLFKKINKSFSIFNEESTFEFIRKKNRNSTDNFDYIESFKEKGKHLKYLLRVNQEIILNLKNLYSRFPNFIEVIDNIEKQLILSSISNGIVKFEPIYLYGEPGIGKTEFVLELSKALKVSLEKVNASTLTGTFSLSGSESQWADSSPGLIIKSLLKNKYSNFIFYLDELEKVHSTGNGGNPLNALFDLLEESSAKRFVDMAFGDTVMFDTTPINFIASGNEKTGVHPAILSRFNVFEVPMPTESQLKIIVQNIHSSLLKNNDWGGYFEETLSDDFIDSLIDEDCSIRYLKKDLRNAYANAYLNKRNYLINDDIERLSDKPFKMGFT